MEEKDKALADRVAKLEKFVDELEKDYKRHLATNHNYAMSREEMKRISQIEYTPKVGISKTETTTKKCHNELGKYRYMFRCSVCGNEIEDTNSLYDSGKDKFNYCPNCGAKVEEEE